MKEEGGCHVLLTVLLLAVSWKQSWAAAAETGVASSTIQRALPATSGEHNFSSPVLLENSISSSPFSLSLPPLLWFNLIFFSCHHWNHLPTYSFDSPPILLHVFVFRLLCVLHKSNPLIFFDVCHHARVTNIQANFTVHTHVCVCVYVHACLVHMHVWEAVLCEYRD